MSRATEHRAGWIWASPFLVGAVVFLAVPVGLALYTGFTDYALIESPLWIGLDNYREMGDDPVFWQSIRNTAVYTAAAVALNFLVSLGLALLLEQRLRGREVVRAVVFAPVLVPIVASAIGWMWLYHQEFGLFNVVLRRLGLSGVDFLGDGRFALMSLVVMGAWVVGSQVLVLTAALRGVPRELIEAAGLDGASAIWRLRAVVLPAIGPALMFNLIVSIIWAAQVFAAPLVMTRGGPAGATQVFTMSIFQNAFQYGRMGYASALAWLQFLVILGLTAIALRLGRRFVQTEAV
ncbi:carbohydrate ABC transporter permease [Engelhardtia mirabilis]|uniref:L-arabinose transport system permease protein AraP n=1 Tax=Engelhardtia mirabilis TaxID=2528011 RepID=A0A518BIL9_9BACT|nr:L-arabinose transport system permease protein AraP [Planctomycetes bacterium Pla133]QDV01156.1 L-arabinose transport system permease protein AraP [Planctomycetes bacterium Pla86]